MFIVHLIWLWWLTQMQFKFKVGSFSFITFASLPSLTRITNPYLSSWVSNATTVDSVPTSVFAFCSSLSLSFCMCIHYVYNCIYIQLYIYIYIHIMLDRTIIHLCTLIVVFSMSHSYLWRLVMHQFCAASLMGSPPLRWDTRICQWASTILQLKTKRCQQFNINQQVAFSWQQNSTSCSYQ